MSHIDWIDWFNLTGDPFSTHPLQNSKDFEQFLIITEPMRLHLSPFINHFEDQKPTIHLVIGPQGIGKSTVLHYVLERLELLYRAIPVYIGILPYRVRNSPDSIFAISIEVLSSTIRSFLTYCYEKRRFLVNDNQKLFEKWLINMGLEFLPEIGISSAERYVEPTFDHLKNLILEILKFTRKQGIRIVIAIDNLDKIEEQVALGYLKVSSSQPLFEAFSSFGVQLLIAANEQWAQTLNREKEFNFLQNKFPLTGLTVPETYDLLGKRFLDKFNDKKKVSFELPFSKRLTKLICEKNKGITRNILAYSREVLKIGFQTRSKTLDIEDLSKQNIPAFSSVYFELTDDPIFSTALSKISRLRTTVKEESSLRIISQYLTNVYNENKTKFVDFQIHKVLIDFGIINLGSTRKQQTYGLESDICSLFRKIEGSGCTISEFLEWFFSGKEQEIVKVKFQSRSVESQFKEILDIFDVRRYGREEITIATYNGPVKKTREHLARWIRRSIEITLRKYLELVREASEIIDNKDLIHNLNTNLFWFVDSFVKRFILETNIPIEANHRSWGFRLKGLEKFASHYSKQLQSSWKLSGFITFHKNVISSSIPPLQKDVDTFYEWFNDIIEELAALWVECFDFRANRLSRSIEIEVNSAITDKVSSAITDEANSALADEVKEIDLSSQTDKREKTVNFLHTLAEEFKDSFNFINNFEINVKTEIWKLIKFMEKIEAIDDLIQSFEAKERENFDDALSKATRSLEIFIKSLVKLDDGFKQKKKLVLTGVLTKVFEKDEKLRRFLLKYAKYSEKNPKESFRNKLYLICDNKKTSVKYPETCEQYIQVFTTAMLIRNFIHHHSLPRRNPIPLKRLYFGLNTVYTSILQLWLVYQLLEDLFGEHTTVITESIDKKNSLLKISGMEDYKLERSFAEEFWKEFSSENLFYWHFLQSPLMESKTFLESVMVLLFFKSHNWLDIQRKHLYLVCKWTDDAISSRKTTA